MIPTNPVRAKFSGNMPDMQQKKRNMKTFDKPFTYIIRKIKHKYISKRESVGTSRLLEVENYARTSYRG